MLTGKIENMTSKKTLLNFEFISKNDKIIKRVKSFVD